MSGYTDALCVEAQGRNALTPFLEQRAYKGRLVWTTKGRLARELQRTAGDLLYNSDEETIVACEIKVESKWTGNLFIERWSNRARWTPGWLETLSTDLLLYYFLDNDKLLVIHFENLRRWLYACEHRGLPLAGKFPQYKQGKHDQLNDTWAYLIAVSALPARSVLMGAYHPQLWLRNSDLVGAA